MQEHIHIRQSGESRHLPQAIIASLLALQHRNLSTCYRAIVTEPPVANTSDTSLRSDDGNDADIDSATADSNHGPSDSESDTRHNTSPYDTSALRTAGSGLVVVGIFGAYHTGVPDAIIDFKALLIHVC